MMRISIDITGPEPGQADGPATVGWFLSDMKGAVIFDQPERLSQRSQAKISAGRPTKDLPVLVRQNAPLNLHISGANVFADVTRKPGERIVSIMVGGAPLDHKAYYSIAAPDFFLRGGDGYTQFTKEALRTRVEDTQLISNNMMMYARHFGEIRAKPEGRMIVQ